MISGAKKIGRSEILVKDSNFLSDFYKVIEDTNYLRMLNIPENINTALQILMCERQYLIQLVKGLIDKVLPKDHPKFFNDPFLEQQYQKLQKPPATHKKFSPIQEPQYQQQFQRPAHARTASSNIGRTVIDGIIGGASNLIKMIKEKSQSPATSTRLQPSIRYNQNQQNLDRLQNLDYNHVMYLRIPPATEKSKTNKLGRPILNQYENLFQRREEVILKIDTQSDSDESVDVQDSSESDLRRSRQLLTVHQMPNKGVVNQLNRIDTNRVKRDFTPNNQKKGLVSNRYQKRQTTLQDEEDFRPLAQFQTKQSVYNFDNEEQKQPQSSKLQIQPQLLNKQSSLRQQQRKNPYQRQPSKNQRKAEEIKEQKSQSRLVPIEEFINLLDQNDSKFQENDQLSQQQQQEQILFTQHNEINESQSTFVKQSQAQISHFKQSQINGIKMKDTFSRLHHDFSLDQSDEKSQHFDNDGYEDEDERRRRQDIGLKMLMSRESSFGVVGFKSMDQSIGSQIQSNNLQSLKDDSIANKQFQERALQKRNTKNFLQDSSDSSNDPYDYGIKFKVKKRKERETNSKPANASKQLISKQSTTRNKNQGQSDNNTGIKGDTRISKHHQSTNDSNIYSQTKKDRHNSIFKSELDLKLKSSQIQQSSFQSQNKSLARSVKWKDDLF